MQSNVQMEWKYEKWAMEMPFHWYFQTPSFDLLPKSIVVYFT